MKLRDKIIWVVALIIVVMVVRKTWLEKNHVTDVTHLRTASPAQVESELKVNLGSSPKMAKKIYEYSKIGIVTMKADEESGVGIVYLNGIQNGFRIEDKKYTMYNITIGKSRLGMESRMTYQYEYAFEIDEDIDKSIMSKKTDFPVFYCNWTNNDCIVVSCNKATGIVVAVTYFNDAKKVTERLKID